jgi:predicted transcriptional regulator of viral defense system
MLNPNAHSAHMEPRRSRPDPDALYSVAEAQAGYFTTAQAGSSGYSRSLLTHHTDAGAFKRARTGVYRLSRFPASQWEDLFVAWLQAGPRAVVSHDSALALYDLSDLLPSETHFTLPRSSSRRRPQIRMHTTVLPPEDVTTREGLPVTSVSRTIADVARAGLPEDLVRQAIRQALDRGLTTEPALRDRAEVAGGRARRLIRAELAGQENR